MPADLVDSLDRLAARENRSRSQQLRHTLERALVFADSTPPRPPRKEPRG